MATYPLHSTATETGLIEQVKVALDENKSSQPLADIADIDTLTLDEIIRSKLEDAARLVEESAANYLLEGEPIGTQSQIVWENRSSYVGGSIVLPADFLRLVSWKMDDWERAVTEAISEEDPLYDLQSSRYGGVRGNPQKPVVAIVHRSGGLTLEFYSCHDTTAVPVKALMVKRPRIFVDGASQTEKLNICEKLVRAVVYRAASMTAATVGDGNLAAVLLSTSNELAGIAAG